MQGNFVNAIGIQEDGIPILYLNLHLISIFQQQKTRHDCEIELTCSLESFEKCKGKDYHAVIGKNFQNFVFAMLLNFALYLAFLTFLIHASLMSLL